MADKSIREPGNSEGPPKKWRDLGDGTYAPSVYNEAPGGSGGDGAILDGSSAVIRATVRDYANSNPVAVQLTDSSGNPSAGTGGGVAQQGAKDASAQMWIVDASGATVPVSGTFWQATQPVSGTVGVSNFPAVQPVSDNAGSLTVDAPVGTPAAARLSDGTAFIPAVNNADADIARVGLVTDARNRVWNGASWDRLPGGTDGVTVRDGGGSLTIDAPVGTPAWVRLSDGAAAFVGQKTMAASIPVVVASDQSAVPVSGTFWQATQPVSGTVTANQGTGAAAGTSYRVKGDQARASATVADPVIGGGRAAAYPTKPAAVAAGQVVDFVTDLEGVQLVRPRTLNTFSAIYRLALAAASSRLSFLTVANTDKQIATIYHAATATKQVRIRRVWVHVFSMSVAGDIQLELRRLSATTAPLTGNPAITPINRNPGGAAVEATALALPGTAGSEFAVNSPVASQIVVEGIVPNSGGPTTNPVYPAPPFVLYDEASADDEEEGPLMRSGNAEGYAVVLRSTVASTITFTVRLVFTEE